MSNVTAFRGSRGPVTPGGGGGDIEVRLAALELRIQHIESDINEIKDDLKAISGGETRLLYAGIGAVAFLIVGGILSYLRLSDQSADISKQLMRVEYTLGRSQEAAPAKPAIRTPPVDAPADAKEPPASGR
jgi:hypothetical protein